MLVLPLAMPAYILGFVFLSTFDEAGPVQQFLRGLLGDGLWTPSVRSLPGAVVVLTMTLFPYVYLMARAAFTEQSPSTYNAARTLGASRGRALRAVVLPLARPSLAAGLALVMMETLTDFATVQYFGVETVSVGVYRVWKGNYNFEAASQLSVLVLMFAVAVLASERLPAGAGPLHPEGRLGAGSRAGSAGAGGAPGRPPRPAWRRSASGSCCRWHGWSTGRGARPRRDPGLVRRPTVRRVPRQQPRGGGAGRHRDGGRSRCSSPTPCGCRRAEPPGSPPR